MLAVQLLMPEDDEEMALTLNGKKRKLKKPDFDTAMLNADIPAKAIENLWGMINKGMQEWIDLIGNSFLHKSQKTTFIDLINLKSEILKI
jgi:serine/threonine-protein kinase HipA